MLYSYTCERKNGFYLPRSSVSDGAEVARLELLVKYAIHFLKMPKEHKHGEKIRKPTLT